MDDLIYLTDQKLHSLLAVPSWHSSFWLRFDVLDILRLVAEIKSLHSHRTKTYVDQSKQESNRRREKEREREKNIVCSFVVCVYWPILLVAFHFQANCFAIQYQAILSSKNDSKFIFSLSLPPSFSFQAFHRRSPWRLHRSSSVSPQLKSNKTKLTFRATFSILIKSFRCAAINCCVSSIYPKLLELSIW